MEATDPFQVNLCPPTCVSNTLFLGLGKGSHPGAEGQVAAGGESQGVLGDLPAPPDLGSPQRETSSPHPLASLSGPGSQGPPVTQGVTSLSKGSCWALKSFYGGLSKYGLQTPEMGLCGCHDNLEASLLEPDPHPPPTEKGLLPGPGPFKNPQPCSQPGKICLAASPSHPTVTLKTQ